MSTRWTAQCISGKSKYAKYRVSKNPRLSTRSAVGRPKERKKEEEEKERERSLHDGYRKRRKRGEEWGERERERESRGKNRGAAVRTRTTLPGPASRRGVLLRSRCLKRNL